ncbi:MAG: hypothetical protein LBQ40_05520 [Clostridiales bacterium]|jgi:hypothetical protein|nr:hypothetical protein [Clostridiales bacterium]
MKSYAAVAAGEERRKNRIKKGIEGEAFAAALSIIIGDYYEVAADLKKNLLSVTQNDGKIFTVSVFEEQR